MYDQIAHGIDMLHITIPNSYLIECRYIINLLMAEFLGLEVEIATAKTNYITIKDGHGKELQLDNILFSTPQSKWLSEASLPTQPLQKWGIADSPIRFGLGENELPLIFGKNPHTEDFLTVTENKICLGLDIFGSAFFMLTRYEEYVRADLDKLDRFPVESSLAYQEDFLHRPIINEYLEILWHLLKTLWPHLSRKSQKYQVHLSHDVDEPFYTFIKNPKRIVGSLYADIAKRKDPFLALGRMASVLGGWSKYDPFDTFDFLMDTSEQFGWQGAFYFMASEPTYDADNRYSLKHPKVRNLLKKISMRGHEVGLHPSMNSYRSREIVAREYDTLSQVLAEENIQQDEIGGRQHYLRWSNPETWQIWNDIGLAYDNTLNFAENPGFRCGICYQYPAFDLENRTVLDLIERPLIVMERFYQRNAEINEAQAVEIVQKLAKSCKHHNGLMTILWHNNALMTSRDKDIFAQICHSI